MRFKQLKYIALLSAIVLMLSFLAGCWTPHVSPSDDRNATVFSSNASIQLFSDSALLQELYCVDGSDYGVYASEVLDTYLISCALYFDFQCPQILPEVEGDTISAQVKDYFAPYKNHPFIEGLNRYVDCENRTQREGVIYPLLMYAFSMVDYNLDVTMVQTDAFVNGEEFQAFLKSLYAFYLDTKAEAFFRSLQPQKDMISFLNTEMERYPVESLLTSMEDFVGNKSELFGEKLVKYRSIMTLYRPFYASFYTIDFGEDVYLVAQQSPHDESRSTNAFNIDQTINTAIHEFLHAFINQPVYEQNNLILQLAEGRTKSNYTAPIYQNMEWHRIVDETVVRAVETTIFSKVVGEQKAFDCILNKEIQSGQMPTLQEVYHVLSTYSAERNRYQTIDTYLPILIAVMFD